MITDPVFFFFFASNCVPVEACKGCLKESLPINKPAPEYHGYGYHTMDAIFDYIRHYMATVWATMPTLPATIKRSNQVASTHAV